MGRPKELTETERADLIARGYRPVEMWLPDLSDPKTLARATAEAKRIAAADEADWTA